MKRNLLAGAVLAVASLLATGAHAGGGDAAAAKRSVDGHLIAEVEIAADGSVRTLAWQVPERKPLLAC